MSISDLLQTYQQRTKCSAGWMERARAVMPGGNTRDWTHHLPYPVVFDHAEGPYMWDGDGNRYVDAFWNGLSIIHWHHFRPLEEAIRDGLSRGAPFPGANDRQVEFAEALCARIPNADRVSFTNSGTEAGMLAVKLARHATGRPYVLKAWGAYHGSYDDLEAGLQGQPLAPDRALLAPFNNADAFEKLLADQGDQIACVIIEPVMCTEAVVPPSVEFLQRVAAAARNAGALLIFDDCLMFRLAPGGSQEKFGVDADITILGKFIGGGLPMGVVAGRESVMRHLDPHHASYLQHGGSYNGNLLACGAGLVSLQHLHRAAIDHMDAQAERLEIALLDQARVLGIPFSLRRSGSLIGVFFAEQAPVPPVKRSDQEEQKLLRIACHLRGVAVGPTGQFATATSVDEEAIGLLIGGACAALRDIAPLFREIGD